MKRNITSPVAQDTLFGSDSPVAVLPLPKAPRARSAAKPATAAPAETTPKASAPKIAKTTPTPALIVPAKAKSATPAKTAATIPPITKAAPSPKVAVVAAKQKNVKTNSITKKLAPAEPVVRVIQESILEGGTLWKMSGKNGVAFVKDAALAGELLATDPKKLAQTAMAVYYDKKGKAFAWQVRFDTDRWDELTQRLG